MPPTEGLEKGKDMATQVPLAEEAMCDIISSMLDGVFPEYFTVVSKATCVVSLKDSSTSLRS